MTYRLVLLPALFAAGLSAQTDFHGRWDLTVHSPTETFPSWMEVTGSASSPNIRMVGRTGSVLPAENISLQGGKLSFSFEKLKLSFQPQGDIMSGTEISANGTQMPITAKRAPKLDHPEPAGWTTPKPLFNGKDLSGWQPEPPAANHWIAQDAALLNQSKGANLRTAEKFGDFRLHIEVNCPKDRNSGIYLRGRYETQIEHESNPEDALHRMGSIYGFLGAEKDVPSEPGQWETFDITLVGRTVTILRNGITTIDHKEIPGITGGAIDSNEGEPGQIYLQGDHTGGMRYRNITIAVPKS